MARDRPLVAGQRVALHLRRGRSPTSRRSCPPPRNWEISSAPYRARQPADPPNGSSKPNCLPGQHRRRDRDLAHVLHAARDHDVRGPAHHGLRGEVHRLLGRAALAVHGDAGHRLGQARPPATRSARCRRPAGRSCPRSRTRRRRPRADPGPSRASSARMTCAPRSAGCAPARPPPRRPTGVRTASTMYASAIVPDSLATLPRTRSIYTGRGAGRDGCTWPTRPSRSGSASELRDYFAVLMTPELRARPGQTGGDYGDGAGLPRQVVRQLGRDGWLALGWPAEYGGRDGSMLDQLIFTDEAAIAGVPVPVPDHQHRRPDDHAVRHRRSRRRATCPGSRPARSTSPSATPSPRPAPTWPRCAPAPSG